jgi:hypothetical protein
MVRQGNLGSAAGHLGVLVVFAAVLFVIAARFFSWEDS